MVVASFFITSVVVLLALGAFQAGRARVHERQRGELESELRTFLSDVQVADPEHGEGKWQNMPTTFELDHYSVYFTVALTPAVIPYRELVARFAPALGKRLAAIGITIDGDDRLKGDVMREADLPEVIVTIENRLPLVAAVRDLRAHVPAELIARIDAAHSTVEIDELLLSLARNFPDAPEIEKAIEHAAAREHEHPDRVRERAERWLGRRIGGAAVA